MKAKLLNILSSYGSVHSYSCQNPPRTDHVVYAVTNGDNILQIGHGSKKRALSVARGSLAKKHNKAFICSLGEAALGGINEYRYISAKSKDDAKKTEEQIHTNLGIKTGVDVASCLANFKFPLSVLEVHQELWERFKTTSMYKSLNSQELTLAHQLFEYVTFATTRIQRTKKPVESDTGDNLEGNIMKAVERHHLIPIYQKITNSYHRYIKHCPTASEMNAVMAGAVTYTPKNKPFVIVAMKNRPVEEHVGLILNSTKFGLY
jgi:hypothetical protein